MNNADFTNSIQRLLFDYPLYNYIEKTGIINIAVIGNTVFTYRFVDQALEVSQVEGLKLNITMISTDAQFKEDYLSHRPYLDKFVSIDNSREDNWGNINFVTTDNISSDTVTGLLLEDEITPYAYVVIDTGDVDLNHSIASETKECIELTSRMSFVAYVSLDTDIEDGICPISPDYTILSHPDYKTLKEMSFNCHLLWNDSDGFNIQKIRNEFRQQYNFNSSFSNVLSIKYKLWSLGILWESDSDLYDLANRFEHNSLSNKKSINELIRYEHQRWCINLVCNGWKPQKKLFYCINGVKDKVNKLHPCLVPSDSKLHLSDKKWKENNYALWDSASPDEMKQLDELDKVSVKLYREFKRQADKMLNGDSYPADDIHSIRALIKNYPQSVLPFERFVLSIKAIANREGYSHIAQYSYNKVRFVKTLAILPTRIRNMVKRYLDNIDALFFPVFESQRHTNYKMADSKLVKSIPFILTYRTHFRIGVPLTVSRYDMNNDMLFSNIASAIRLNPSRVTYFVDYSQVNTEVLLQTFNYIIKGFDVRNLQSFINIVVLIKKGHNTLDDEAISKLKSLSKRVKTVKIYSYDKVKDLKIELSRLLSARNYTALEENNSAAFGLLSGMGFYDSLPHFIYDSKESIFSETVDCECFNYIDLPSHLRISDIIDLKNANENTNLPELQSDYMFFWNYYKGGLWSGKEKLWKMMCRALEEHKRKNDLLLSVSISRESTAQNSYSWFVPQICYNSIKQIIEGLKAYDVLGQASSIEFHTTSSCKVTLLCVPAIKKQFDVLFSEPYDLCEGVKIQVVKEKQIVKVFSDTLKVKDFKVTVNSAPFPSENDISSIISNLRDFEKAGYIIHFTQTDDSYSFCYSSEPIKRLLTQEGFLLEMYVYYKVLSTGYFDEVYSGAEITVNKNISNEFDLLLVKGYKSLVVEIKARTELNQDIYHKLANLTKQYGINATPVLISDTIEKEKYDNSINEMQRNRGDEYGIITIHKFEDIKNIGKELIEVMKRR